MAKLRAGHFVLFTDICAQSKISLELYFIAVCELSVRVSFFAEQLLET